MYLEEVDPSAGFQLLKYMQHIRHLSEVYGSSIALLYDEKFRRARTKDASMR